jgi:hypothetical protein
MTTSRPAQPQRAFWFLAMTLCALIALGAIGTARAAAVSDSEELFELSPALGGGAGQLFGGAVATDPVTGHIFITDSVNHRIDEYTPWGTFVKAFGWDVAPGAVNEQQEIRVRAATGQFRLGFEGSSTGSLPLETTAKGPQAAAAIERALDELPAIVGAGGNVSVTASQGTADGVTPYIYVVTFKGGLAGKNVPALELEPGTEPLTGGQPSTVEEVITRANGGPASKGFEDCTSESGCQAGPAAVTGGGGLTDPEAITMDSAGQIFVTVNAAEGEMAGVEIPANFRVEEFNRSGEFLRTFGGDVVSDGAAGTGDLTAGSTQVTAVTTTSKFFEVGQELTGSGLQPGTIVEAVAPGVMTLSKPATETASGETLEAPPGAGNLAANERQTISIGQGSEGLEATGGTFELTFKTPSPSPSSDTTVGLPPDATAAEVETALGDLTNLDPTDIAVTGEAGGPWTVEFVGPRFGDSAPPRLMFGTENLLPHQERNFEYEVSIEMQTAPEVCTSASTCRTAIAGVGVGEFNSGPHFITFPNGMSRLTDGWGGITTTSEGVFVADHDRVQRFNFTGEPQSAFPTPGETAFGLAPTVGGDLWTHLHPDGATSSTRYNAAETELSATTGAHLAEILLQKENENGLDQATDSAGNLYAGWSPNNVRESGTEPYRVNQFRESTAPLTPSECCGAPLVREGATLNHLTLVHVATNSVGDLLVTYSGEYGSDSNFPGDPKMTLKMFGPGPVSLEAPPVDPPTILAQSTSSVLSTEASISGLINPHFWTDTKYYVEYGTGNCEDGGCTAKKPVPPGAILTSSVRGSAVRITPIALEGLQPNTTYHYRLVAESGGGGPVVGVGGEPGSPGAAGTFTTAAASSGSTACPNAALRSGPSAPLPDCRAYEMVSPVDKDGGDIKTLLNAYSYSNALDQSSTAGQAFTFSSYRAFGTPEGAAMTDQYLATRQEGKGWETTSITPRQSVNGSGNGYSFVNWDNEYRAFSPDLCQAWAFVASEPPLAAGTENEQAALYKGDNCPGPGGFEFLAQGRNASAGQPEVELLGVSGSGNAAVVRSVQPLNSFEPGGVSRSYYLSNGQAQPLCILPDGSLYSGSCSAGTDPILSGLIAEGEGNRVGTMTNAISADGSKVYWTAISPGSEGGVGRIYLRVNPGAEQSPSGECESGKACTVKVSETIKGSTEARFWAASSDGSRALFQFAKGALAGNLYEFNAEEGESRLVAKKSLGYVGGAENLSIFYFVSEEKLIGTQGATSGQPNLYVEQGGSPTFIATLSREDANATAQMLSDVSPQAVFHIARTTPDGRTLAFLSTNSLTGYDNTDVASPLPCGVKEGSVLGVCDSEVYLYRVDGGVLSCISCDPTGAQPEGRDGLKVGESTVPFRVAANLTAPTTQLYVPRNLTDEGRRVFFDSYGPLVPRDTNGREDVYEWEAGSAAECEADGAEAYVPSSGGCLSLISSGESSSDSEFLDADTSGANAFFNTNASLLPQDPGLFDVYDARIGGGFPQPTTSPVCEGEACQGPANPPNDPTPSSSTFNGFGNVKEKKPAAKQKKKQNKKKQKKGKKKKHKKGKKKAGKRGAGKGKKGKKSRGSGRRG